MEIRNQGAEGAKRALEAFHTTREHVQRASQERVQEARAELERLARSAAQRPDTAEVTRPAELREARQAHLAHHAHHAHHEGGDSVELSDRGRALAAGDQHRAAALRLEQQEFREARIAAIREELRAGTFHDPERLLRAAEALLHHAPHQLEGHEGHHEG